MIEVSKENAMLKQQINGREEMKARERAREPKILIKELILADSQGRCCLFCENHLNSKVFSTRMFFDTVHCASAFEQIVMQAIEQFQKQHNIK